MGQAVRVYPRYYQSRHGTQDRLSTRLPPGPGAKYTPGGQRWDPECRPCNGSGAYRRIARGPRGWLYNKVCCHCNGSGSSLSEGGHGWVKP